MKALDIWDNEVIFPPNRGTVSDRPEQQTKEPGGYRVSRLSVTQLPSVTVQPLSVSAAFSQHRRNGIVFFFSFCC